MTATTDKPAEASAALADVPIPANVHRVRILLFISSLLLFLWIAAMLVMYFKTVYPLRHPAATPANAKPVYSS